MTLDAQQIADLFPHGARGDGVGHWQPAEPEKADLKLAALLRAKKARQEKPRLLASAGRHRMRWDQKTRQWIVPEGWAPGEAEGYTSEPRLAMPGEPEAVDEETQARLTRAAERRHKETHAEELARREMRSCLAQMRQLALMHIREGRDPAPIFRAALEQLSESEAAA